MRRLDRVLQLNELRAQFRVRYIFRMIFGLAIIQFAFDLAQVDFFAGFQAFTLVVIWAHRRGTRRGFETVSELPSRECGKYWATGEAKELRRNSHA